MEYEIYYKARGGDRFSNIEHTFENKFEVIQILSGEGTVLTGSCAYPMIKGAIYFIDMSKPHCTCPVYKDEYVRNKLIIETDAFTAFLRSAFALEIIEEALTKGGMCLVLEENAAQKACGYFFNMYENRDKKSALMMEILKLVLLSGNYANGENPQDTGIIGSAVGYIDKNIRESIRASELARKLHISKFYLCHLFKQKTGITISEYIILKRLAEAKRLLAESDIKISDIALDLGFSSFSYFCQIFKQRYEMTPGEFRKKCS